ncbi:MAG: M4 family metallopeptidase [Planctomycetota bacterium]
MFKCECQIVPKDVLERFAGDNKLKSELRKSAKLSADLSHSLRSLRSKRSELTRFTISVGAHLEELEKEPELTVFDCKHTYSLPGSIVNKPETSKDSTAKRCFSETKSVSEFYDKVFNRNSIDNSGMSLLSSIHYGSKFNNAMWNGGQMVYGDGDGQLFTDFTSSNDVIAHELTHGVTQYTLQLNYEGDAGGLNESLSDCFGSMFRQWEADQAVDKSDWLIGADIIGPVAKARGFKCLRNMANPSDSSALAPQPTMYSQITPGMDPHYSSGPPNLAFATACLALGGKSWEVIGQIWYTVMTTSGARPDLTIPAFATLTRQVAAQMYPQNQQVSAAVDAGWKKIGL